MSCEDGGFYPHASRLTPHYSERDKVERPRGLNFFAFFSAKDILSLRMSIILKQPAKLAGDIASQLEAALKKIKK